MGHGIDLADAQGTRTRIEQELRMARPLRIPGPRRHDGEQPDVVSLESPSPDVENTRCHPERKHVTQVGQHKVDVRPPVDDGVAGPPRHALLDIDALVGEDPRARKEEPPHEVDLRPDGGRRPLVPRGTRDESGRSARQEFIGGGGTLALALARCGSGSGQPHRKRRDEHPHHHALPFSARAEVEKPPDGSRRPGASLKSGLALALTGPRSCSS